MCPAREGATLAELDVALDSRDCRAVGMELLVRGRSLPPRPGGEWRLPFARYEKLVPSR